MDRAEMLELRKCTYDRLVLMRKAGDYGAGVADIRENAEATLRLIDHMLEKMRKS